MLSGEAGAMPQLHPVRLANPGRTYGNDEGEDASVEGLGLLKLSVGLGCFVTRIV